MRIFVTGASGWIGSASVLQLVAAGHEVLALARSEASAARIEQLGAEVVRGDLDDVALLRAAAAESDGVAHFAYDHDFSQMAAAARADHAAIEAFADALEGSGGPLLVASGLIGLAPGRILLEEDVPREGAHARIANATHALALAARDIRSMVIRFAPTVHGAGGDHGFVAVLARIAREKKVSGFVADGLNRWPAVHRLDAAKLVRLAIEKADPGSVLHAVAEEGIRTRDIAIALGTFMDVPTQSVPPEDAQPHFGWMGMFVGTDAAASSERTRTRLGWEPVECTLLEDVAAGHYPGR